MLLHKTPYGAENTMYYLLFAIELWRVEWYFHMSAVHPQICIFLHKGTFINHVDTAGGGGVCQMSILLHKLY